MIIAVIAIPLILNIIEKSKERAMDVNKKMMIKAAELYTFDHENLLSLAPNEKYYIQLSELEGKYIKKINNPSGNEKCDGYVKVEKNTDFIYTPYLDCGNGYSLLISSSYVNYGGKYLDEFTKIIKTSDGGYVAIGRSNSKEYSGNHNKGTTENLNYDAIIVKYNNQGVEEWSHNFGGGSIDTFYDVIEVNEHLVVTGTSSYNDVDLLDLNPMQQNAFVLKYDLDGNLVFKKILFKFNGTRQSEPKKILYKNGYYYVFGRSSTNAYNAFGVKYDENFNQIWLNVYSSVTTHVYDILEIEDDIIVVGTSNNKTGFLSDIVFNNESGYYAYYMRVSSLDGSIIDKGIFGGLGEDRFRGLVEVPNGFVAVGSSDSLDYDLTGYNIGKTDALVVKYSYSELNNNYVVDWVRTVGGSGDDYFLNVIYHNNKIVAVGYSNSNDGDLTGINKTFGSDYDGILFELDLNGNIINKATYGGGNSDYLTSIIFDDDYILSGYSFSTSHDIEPFNFGNSDALIARFDENFNPKQQFMLKTLLKESPKVVVKNYGNSIPLPENRSGLKLYTTNDAENDLGNWCTTNQNTDPNSNYNYVPCLKPFDEGNITTLLSEVYNLENNFTVDTDGNKWLSLVFGFGSAGENNEVSNLKLTFLGESPVTVEEAVTLGYIEPLVLSGQIYSTNNYFSNSFNLIYGGSSGYGTNPTTRILIKPKNKKLIGISFNSSRDGIILSKASFELFEFTNFDISLSKVE